MTGLLTYRLWSLKLFWCHTRGYHFWLKMPSRGFISISYRDLTPLPSLPWQGDCVKFFSPKAALEEAFTLTIWSNPLALSHCIKLYCVLPLNVNLPLSFFKVIRRQENELYMGENTDLHDVSYLFLYWYCNVKSSIKFDIIRWCGNLEAARLEVRRPGFKS